MNIKPIKKSEIIQELNNIDFSNQTLLGTPRIQKVKTKTKNMEKSKNSVKRRVFNILDIVIDSDFGETINILSGFLKKYSENFNTFHSLRLKVKNDNNFNKELLIYLPRYGIFTHWFRILITCTKTDDDLVHIQFQPLLFSFVEKILILFGILVCIVFPIAWLLFIPFMLIPAILLFIPFMLIPAIMEASRAKTLTKNYLNDYLIPNFINETNSESLNPFQLNKEEKFFVNQIKVNIKSILKASFIMMMLSILLCWIPLLGPFVGGYIGGRRTVNIKNSVLAAILPTLTLSTVTTIFIGYFSQFPILGILAGMGVAVFLLGIIIPLILGAVLGGANPKQ